MHVIGRFTHIDCPPRPLETFTPYNKPYFPLSIGYTRAPRNWSDIEVHLGSVTMPHRMILFGVMDKSF